ncbi:MAG: S41 family peptidase [Anaerolineales bacterium]|nr:S41 family peptidase [Anaerolineales bacterium]MCS7247996.1 S41 family peptidase [Anaerolineales bacterium]MDW8161808.1 S41 family peptidase [Anaerolineales bacterium]MDW8446497.1 S41 family peptidase [Anaerolineales bacterium]
MESRRPPILIILALFVIVIGATLTGFYAGRISAAQQAAAPTLPGTSSREAPSAEVASDQNVNELFAPFWQTWRLIHEQYVEQPVDDVKLMRGAIQGMLNALEDEHTSYIDPESLELYQAQISGTEYEGIGAYVDTTREYLTIIAPMMGSPAEKAGLKPGDQIIAIDGEDMTGIDGELVRQRVLGPAGTKVRLTIKRPGVEKPFDVEIVRATIKSTNVIGRMERNNIAYIRLIAFGDENTTRDLRQMLRKLLAENPQGLILDLRNNGGGLLNSAIDIASEFIKEGVIAYEVYGDGRKETFRASGKGLATEIPLVVLVNEGSASASEIVAGAIQDLGRGKLVGATTYGKGSVQVWNDLVNNQGAVRITVARWLTPKGRTIQGTGLTPDVEVAITEEDYAAGKDPQLDKAIELLTK